MFDKYKKNIIFALIVAGLSSGALVSANMMEHSSNKTVNAETQNSNKDDETKEAIKQVEKAHVSHLKLNANSQNTNEPLLLSFCFHEVGYNDDALSIRPNVFRKMLRELVSQGFVFLDANDIVAIKKGKMEQPEKGIFIGFDDGYKDNYTYAYPIIKEEGAKATFFLVSGMISHPNRMTYSDIKEMVDNGMAIGSHTVNHAELNKLSPDEIFKELNDSKYDLEKAFGVPVESVAYPCGGENEVVREKTQEVYEIGFTANMDENVPNTPITIHRYGVFKWNNSIGSVLSNPQG